MKAYDLIFAVKISSSPLPKIYRTREGYCQGHQLYLFIGGHSAL